MLMGTHGVAHILSCLPCLLLKSTSAYGTIELSNDVYCRGFWVLTGIVFVTEEKTQNMRIPAITGVLAVLVLAASAVNAADIKSGLQVGDPIVTYTGEKCGGIVDGIAVGRNLCYT